MNYWGIQKHILWLTLLPCLITAIALGGYFTWDQHQQLVRNANQQALMLSQQLSVDAAKLFTQERQHSQRQLRQFLDLPHIRSIALLDGMQSPIIEVGPTMYPPESKRIIENGTHRFDTLNSIRLLTPIFDHHSDIKNRMFGWIEIEFKTNEQQLVLYRSLFSSTLLIILCCLLAVYLAYRASKRVTIPLLQVSNTLSELETGNLDARVQLSDFAEFGELYSGINAMAASLQQAQQELQDNVEQTTEDLKSTVDAMETQNIELSMARRSALEASKTKSEFLANMSHEIRTPLNGILGFSKLLEKTQLTKRQQEYLNTIEASSSSLLTIINDILDFSKIEAGKLVLDHVPVNIRDLCDDVLTMLAPEVHKKDIELAAMVYQDVPMDVMGDPTRIKQVLTNLVNNAIKFTESGSVIVRVMLEEELKNKMALKFTITDTGIGLSESQQSNLFKAFSQGDTSTTRKFGGTGLGLVISKHIVSHMQGEIGLNSQLGAGSQFWFTGQFEACDVEAEAWDDTPWFGKLAYLQSDLDTTKQVLQHQLQAIGFQVKVFPSAKAMLTAQMDKVADVCLLEIQKSTDCQTIELIQRSCKTIALLQNNEAHSLKIFKQLNLEQRLVYPVSTRRLVHVIHEQFNGYLQSNLGFLNQKLSPIKVLAVDDNQPNLELLNAWLGDLNVEVVTANGGLQAVEFAQHENFDLIFMDIQMPDLDGLSATIRIREYSQNLDTPVIALTAHALPNERKQLLQNGFDDYLTKPISEEQLVHTLMKWTKYQGYGFSKTQKSITHNETENQPDNTVINWKECLQLAGGKEDLAHKMLLGLVDEITVIKPLIDSGQTDDLIEPIHKLHGLCKYVGARHLRDCVEKAELCLKTHSEQWPEFKENLLLAIIEVQEWQKQNLSLPLPEDEKG
ncbi:response regulator [Oceaniserpentilla sp. 4NH20-0058]|uniref:hybrid sensor histidine kinase/response regulator n=1 Tax=Oceaniserpentilla sp. 4NH20-0058 TaxID=3127660 RepID=UPI0031038774